MYPAWLYPPGIISSWFNATRARLMYVCLTFTKPLKLNARVGM